MSVPPVSNEGHRATWASRSAPSRWPGRCDSRSIKTTGSKGGSGRAAVGLEVLDVTDSCTWLGSAEARRLQASGGASL